MSPTDDDKWGVKQTTDLGGGDRAEIEFSIVPFSQIVNCVCETCNNEWMSNIETDAQRILKSVLVGRGRDIHKTGQINVATWVLLRALVLQYTHPKVLTAPRQMYDWLYEHRARKDREPPPRLNVWLGAYQSGDHAPQYAHTGLGAASDPSDSPEALGFATTFTVGHLVAHVVGFKATREDPQAVDSKPIREVLVRVWPRVSETVRWPPKKILTTRGVFELSTMFGRPGDPPRPI